MPLGNNRTIKLAIDGHPSITELRPFETADEFIPKVGNQIKIADFPNQIFIVIRTIGLEDSADYTIVVKSQSDQNLVNGGDRRKFPEYFLRAKLTGTSDGYLLQRRG